MDEFNYENTIDDYVEWYILSEKVKEDRRLKKTEVVFKVMSGIYFIGAFIALIYTIFNIIRNKSIDEETLFYMVIIVILAIVLLYIKDIKVKYNPNEIRKKYQKIFSNNHNYIGEKTLVIDSNCIIIRENNIDRKIDNISEIIVSKDKLHIISNELMYFKPSLIPTAIIPIDMIDIKLICKFYSNINIIEKRY